MGDGLLLGGERIEQFVRVVLRAGADTFAFLRPALYFGGIGTEEERRGGHHLRAVHGEVERQMMAFDAPAPLASFARRAEDREEIPFRIADISPGTLLL